MRIAICTAQIPLVSGGAELLALNLKIALQQQGHEADIVAIPFKWYPPYELLQSMLPWQLIDLEESSGRQIDLVIGLKFPAYLVKHNNKVLWLLHQHRPAYDLWNSDYSDLRLTSEGARVRDIIIDTDNRVLREARRIFTISRTVAQRLKQFNNIDAEPLYHPSPRKFAGAGTFGDYIFYPSRLERIKRQSLLIEAMRFVRTKAACVIAGAGPQEQTLRKLVNSYGLEQRVHLAGFVSDDDLERYYSGCLCVFCGPLDEDLGYVVLEAFGAAKPVIALSDSGGPLEFVRNGVNGWVVPPRPEDIARQIDEAFRDREKARQLGQSGLTTVSELNCSWPNVVSRLTS